MKISFQSLEQYSFTYWREIFKNEDKLTSEIFVQKISIEHSAMCNCKTESKF